MKDSLKTQFVLCLVSAVFGAGIVAWLVYQRNDVVANHFVRSNAVKSGIAAPSMSFLQEKVPAPVYSSDESTNINVYESVNKSVVNISTRSYTRDPFFLTAEPQEGAGSGSILDKNGHILTNYHVIEGASYISVTLFDGSQFNAEIVGADPENDTAVIKIVAPVEQLFPVKFGDSSSLRVGQKILAIGNPFGLERTLSVGIVSALNRTLPGRVRGYVIKDVIQIDAALNRGNSGGPLLNNQGLLIGMNTAIANPSGSGENTGVGFSIPVNTLRSVVPQLIKFGKVIRPDVGIVHTTPIRGGLRVNMVAPNGPAAKAGLRGIRVVRKQARQGRYILEYETPDYDYADIIVAVDGQRVKSYSDLRGSIENRKPGDAIRLSILREGKPMDVSVVLGVED